MSAIAKKTGNSTNAITYYLMGTEQGMSGKQGLWREPTKEFNRAGLEVTEEDIERLKPTSSAGSH